MENITELILSIIITIIIMAPVFLEWLKVNRMIKKYYKKRDNLK